MTVRFGTDGAGHEKRAVAVGVFDGVHIGHRDILRAACGEKERGLVPAVLTFSGMDAAGIKPFRRIFGRAEMENHLSEAGVEETFVLDFSEIRNMDCGTFVRDVLVGRLNAEAAVVGEGFRFGRSRSGGAELLRDLMHEAGRECLVVPDRVSDGETVSSSGIRALLENGEIEKANRWMGHPMIWTLPVSSGAGLGRTIGYPTLNQRIPEDRVLPKFGVYEAAADTGEGVFRGLCNVGVKPTVGGTVPLLETYLDGFSGTLYGRTVTVSLFRFLRPERRFHDIGELKEQIGRDISEAFLRG